MRAWRRNPQQKLNAAQQEGITGKTADLGNGYYLNPVLVDDYSDPTVLKDGQDYFIYGGLKPGILIW